MALRKKILSKRFILLSVVVFVLTIVLTSHERHKIGHLTQLRALFKLTTEKDSNPSSLDQSQTSSKVISTPKTNVVFLKVHKAASSTVQNIFLRFALYHQLNVLLIKNDHKPHINENENFIPPNETVPIPRQTRFNILTHHLVFNKNHIRPFFPDDTVYIGIVREPYSRFVSSLYYYATVWNMTGLRACIPHDDPIQTFLLNPQLYDPITKTKRSQVNNRMVRDFGMSIKDIKKSKNDDGITLNFVEKLDPQLDLVLIMEYFDESMVLMKRLLNWTFKDVLYVKINQLTSKVKRKTIENAKSNRILYRNYAPAEFILYDYFLSKFIDKMKALGEEFVEEVEAFSNIRKKADTFCQEDHTMTDQKAIRLPRTRWSESFTITSRHCVLMKMDEVPLTDLVRKAQVKRLWGDYLE